VSSFYKMDPAAWDFGTADLGLEEEAAYLRIVNAIHKHDGPVPNIDRVLAGMFRCSTRKARALVQALIDAGKITVEDGKLWNFRARSELVQRQFASISSAERGAKGGRTRAENAAKVLKSNDPPQAVAATRIEENRIEEKEKTPPTPQGGCVAVSHSSPEFDKIWPHYPRHVGKAAAAKAWAKARKRAGYDEIAAPLRACIRAWSNTPPDKIPHFATWLNRDGWLDDPGHAANRPRTGAEDVAHLSRVTAAEDLARLFPAPQLRIAQ
jgi:uncharacterized protein YdaU (DUF1376 family)